MTGSYVSHSFESQIRYCAFSKEDLKKIFAIFNAANAEAAKIQDSFLFLVEGEETYEQFQERRREILDLFVTTIRISGDNGVTIQSDDISILDEANIPTGLKFILIDTSTRFRGRFNFSPRNQASLFLDFTNPTKIISSGFPSAGTPNESNIKIIGDNLQWVTSLKSQIMDLINARNVSARWIHQSNIWDFLLVFAVFPLSFWVLWKTSPLVPEKIKGDDFFRIGTYLILLFIIMNLFRALFSYARWILPVIEVKEYLNRRIIGHRYFLSAILLGIIGTFLSDIIKSLF